MSEPAPTPVVRTVEIAATRERVFELLTTPAEMVRWWPEAASFEARVGGEVRLQFDRGGEVSGRVTRLDPPHGLAFTWNQGAEIATLVELELSELEGGGTRLRLRHSGWEALPAAQAEELRGLHAAGWRHFLERLGALAGGEGSVP